MIKLFSKPNCPHCVQAKNYLTRHEIPFETIDVMEDADALAFIRAKGHKTVPQLYVGDTVLVEGGNAALQQLTPTQVRDRVAQLNG